MKSKPKQRFLSYHFHKFVEDEINKLSPDQYSLLDDEDRRLIKQLPKASLEQKLWILGKMGHRFAVVVYRRRSILNDAKFMQRVVRLINLFKKKVSTQHGGDLRELGLFVMDDGVMMKALSNISSVLNNKTYYIVKDYEKLARHFDSATDTHYDMELQLQAKAVLDNFLLQAFLALRVIEKTATDTPYNLPANQFIVMLCLHTLKNSSSEITIATMLGLTTSGVRWHADQLGQKGYAERFKFEDHWHLRLTGLGEVVLSRMRNFIIQKTLQ